MTPRPAAVRALTSYAGSREDYATAYARGVVAYTAPCPACLHLAEYVAGPDIALTVWCPTCEARP